MAPAERGTRRRFICKTFDALRRDVLLSLSFRQRFRRRGVAAVTLLVCTIFALLVSTPRVLSPAVQTVCRCKHRYNQSAIQDVASRSQLIAAVHRVNGQWRIHTLYKGGYTLIHFPISFDNDPCASWHSLRSAHIFLLFAQSYHVSEANRTTTTTPHDVRLCYSPPSYLLPTLSAAHALQGAISQPGDYPLRNGTSIVAACKDRSDTLRAALASWRGAAGVDQIVIVDWSSDPPISVDGHDVLLARVVGREAWVLSRAYNVALQLVSFRTTVKVDCDTILDRTFVAHHPSTDVVYGGNRSLLDFTHDHDQLHANGVLVAPTALLRAVGGYDERIITYGWDDSDIVSRLAATGVTVRPVDLRLMRHMRHSAARRLARSPASPQLLPAAHPLAAAVEIQRNRLLVSRAGLPSWGPASYHSRYILSSTLQLHAVDGAEVVPALVSIGRRKLNELDKKAIRIILRRFGTTALSRKHSLDFLIHLITVIARVRLYASVFVDVAGLGPISTALVVAKGLQYATTEKAQPEFEGWRLKILLTEKHGRLIDDIFDLPAVEYSYLQASDDIKSKFNISILPSTSMSIRDCFQNFRKYAHIIERKQEMEMSWWDGIGINEDQRKNLENEHRVSLAIKQCDLRSIIPNSDEIQDGKNRQMIRNLLKPKDKLMSSVLEVLSSVSNSRQHHRTGDDFTTLSILYPSLKTAIDWDESELKLTAAMWSGSSADPNNLLVSSLLLRAQAVVTALLLRSRESWDAININGRAVPEEVKQAVLRVSTRVFYLFDPRYEHTPGSANEVSGSCTSFPTAVRDAIVKIPELAVVAAALLTAHAPRNAFSPSLHIHSNHPVRHNVRTAKRHHAISKAYSFSLNQ